MPQENNPPQADWMSTIPKEKKVGIIVPLYGYWADLPVKQLTEEELALFMTAIKTTKLKSHIFFAGEMSRLPKPIQDIVIGRSQGGSVIPVDIEPFSPYMSYVKDAIDCCLEETDCEFLVIANPWILLRDNSIDQMVEMLNTSGADIISGIDLRKTKWGEYQNGIPPQLAQSFNFAPPLNVINKDFDMNFWGMSRRHAQVLDIDTGPTAQQPGKQGYKTIYFVEPDVMGASFQNRFTIMSTQFLPFYSFDVQWGEIEVKEDFEEDKAYFQKKWRFLPAGIEYK